ncbi:unnamed protein product [Auanema sp. JU1783]|nr:unnamed protein product [Auanema sp. JU1783]
MIGDVQSILSGDGSREKDDNILKLSSLTSVGKKAIHKKQDSSSFKKPEGMHRELFNLLKSSDLQSIMPTEIKKGYRNPKAQIGLRAVRKYKWVPFINEARSDNMKLYHWQRVDRLENPQPYPFAKFNKEINIPKYTDEEYEKHLKSTKWTKDETDYLFDVCRRFDIRWVIVHDRYDKAKFGTSRSMEDMKDRFYSIVHELATLKDLSVEPICYDAEHEKRRKEQLNKQWNRSKEEIEEEEELMKHMKNIEARKKERERKAQDLQKLINMTEAPCSPSLSGGMSPALGKKKSQFRQKTGPVSGSSAFSFNPIDISVSAIRYPEFKSAGAHFRSQEMKLPTNIGQRKIKNIEVVLEKCSMEMNPMGSEGIVQIYNDFRSQVMLLQELKATLQTAEFELETIRTRMQDNGLTLEMEPRMRISNLPDGGFDKSVVNGEEGAPRSARRICSYIDVSTAANPVIARKRKNPGSTSTSVDFKRSRKN